MQMPNLSTILLRFTMESKVLLTLRSTHTTRTETSELRVVSTGFRNSQTEPTTRPRAVLSP